MIKKLPKEKRDRLLLVVITTLVALVALWQGVMSLQKRKLAQLATKKFDQEIQVSNAQRLVSSETEIKRNLVVRRQDLKEVEVSMASGDMYSWIITKINQFKIGYDVDIPQFSREVSTEVGVMADYPYKAVLFNLRGRAFYHDLGRFLADFENTFPYMRVQNVELEPASSSYGNPGGGSDSNQAHHEKLSFRLEVMTLVNPNSL